MTADEKILKALKTARTHLQNSIVALNKKDESAFVESLWHVGAELEYALFLFSVTSQNESTTSKWKTNPELKKDEPVLRDVQNLLNEAETHMTKEKLLDSYKSAYTAKQYLIKVQDDLAKKKREALKKR